MVPSSPPLRGRRRLRSPRHNLESQEDGTGPIVPDHGRPAHDVSGFDLDDADFTEFAHNDAAAESATDSRRITRGRSLSRHLGNSRQPRTVSGSRHGVAASSINFGHFRRRAREGSILAPRSDAGDVPGSEYNSSDLDDLNAYSTPSDSHALAPSSPPHPTFGAEAAIHMSSGPSPHSPANPANRTLEEGASRQSSSDEDDNDVEGYFRPPNVVRSSSRIPLPEEESAIHTTSMPPVVTANAAVDDLSIFAPPASEADSFQQYLPPINKTTRRHKHKLDEPESDISSVPSLSPPTKTRSPASRSTRAAVAANKSTGTKSATADKPASTAQLTSMLAQRGRKRQREDNAGNDAAYDSMSPEDDDVNDDDYVVGNRKRNSASKASTTGAVTSTTFMEGVQNGGSARARGVKRATKRRYGKGMAAEDESTEANSYEANANSEPSAEPLAIVPGGRGANDSAAVNGVEKTSRERRVVKNTSKELEEAKKKFKEVDSWALDFETVDRPSSPPDAR